ncbi:MFS transporter [Actinacidiphila epipremni]|uniref:MFS transporter n=1 Tax=Actinacidiphila epipremni TaxID=2053013 RepID=A0ABX0ZFZ6_9ACTN|nr:MFS transporter [Actinacidiphila epipremni]NJP42032.1 MFS transporter [Actinacidiphila epipremni]
MPTSPLPGRPGARLPGERAMLGAMAVDAVGSGMYVPFTLLFFHHLTGHSFAVVGAVLSAVGLAGMAGLPLAGAAVDRYGARRVQLLLYAVRGTGFALYPFASALPAFAAVALVTALGDRAFPAVQQSWIGEVAGGADRDRLQAASRALRNAGLGAGALLASLLLSLTGNHGFTLAAWLNATSFALAFALMRRVHAMPSPHATPPSPAGVGTPGAQIGAGVPGAAQAGAHGAMRAEAPGAARAGAGGAARTRAAATAAQGVGGAGAVASALSGPPQAAARTTGSAATGHPVAPHPAAARPGPATVPGGGCSRAGQAGAGKAPAGAGGGTDAAAAGKAGYRAVAGDRPFLVLAGANFLTALGYSALGVLFPLFIAGPLHGPEALTGAAFTVNTVLCAVGGVHIARLTRRGGTRRTRAAALGAALFAVSFAGLALLATVRPAAGWLTGALLLALVTLYTAAELVHSPSAGSLAVAAAPEALRGRYLAAYQLSWSLAAIVAPSLFTALSGADPRLPWLLLTGTGLLAAALLLRTERALPPAAVHLTTPPRTFRGPTVKPTAHRLPATR